MTFCRTLLVLTALPALAAAADPEMMNLVMPDGSVVVEINIAKIMASPIGAAMRDAVHKGIATQLKAKLAETKPEIQEQMAVLGDIDWSQEVQDVVISGDTGKHPRVLMIARTSFDLTRIQALKVFSGDTTEYEGIPILVSSKPGNGVIAFLDGIVVIGEMSEVKSAIHRRSQPTALPAALAAQVAKYSQDDIWVASTAVMTAPLPDSPALKSPAGAKVAEFFGKVAGFSGGLRFGPDFDFSADLIARTEKGAAELAEGLRSLTGMMHSQAKIAGKDGNGLDAFKYRLNGKHILLSMHVPAEQMRAGMQQMRAAQAAQPTVAARQAAPVMAPSSGLPPPPAGTIRVQSSEMGTVLLPAGKQP